MLGPKIRMRLLIVGVSIFALLLVVSQVLASSDASRIFSSGG